LSFFDNLLRAAPNRKTKGRVLVVVVDVVVVVVGVVGVVETFTRGV
jgi:hypothetical protein